MPAFIRRYYEAKLDGSTTVTMWGTGEPQRDFVYAGDVAKVIPYFIEKYDSPEPVNISSGTRVSIRELADTIREMTGFDGQIEWDRSKPDGQMVKIFAVDRLRALGLSCETTIRKGLERTINWFAQNYESRGDSLRL